MILIVSKKLFHPNRLHITTKANGASMRVYKLQTLTLAHNKVYLVRECATVVTSANTHAHKMRNRDVNNRNVSYLIVPVGEGTGEAKLESDCGMFIRSGGRTFVLGGLGTRFGVLSLTKDVKRTFTFVEGNRSTQLKKIH